MKTIVKRTLTLLLTAALFTSALTGCTDSFSPDQQAAAVSSTAETVAGSEVRPRKAQYDRQKKRVCRQDHFLEDKTDEVYSFVIDNASVKVEIPTK